jgi:hypothetical protein
MAQPEGYQWLKLIVGQELWLTPVILATREAEIIRTAVPGQPRQKVPKSPYQLTMVASACHLS